MLTIYFIRYATILLQLLISLGAIYGRCEYAYSQRLRISTLILICAIEKCI